MFWICLALGFLVLPFTRNGHKDLDELQERGAPVLGMLIGIWMLGFVAWLALQALWAVWEYWRSP